MPGGAEPQRPAAALGSAEAVRAFGAEETVRMPGENGTTPALGAGDQFYGDRRGGVRDAFGNQWWLATHVEDLSPEEIEKRRAALAGAGS
ncbi:MAG: hypothetical protein H0T39_03205 [Actinobacteria bacterium]|nr:hypothetical protein [Actinomycetota bacterium]